MPANLREVTKADSRSYFTGGSYKNNIAPPKKHYTIEGFAADKYFSDQEAIPEAVLTGTYGQEQYHPTDLVTPTQGLSSSLQQELEHDVNKILCKDALAHYRSCVSCRQKIILELQNIEANEANLSLSAAVRKSEEVYPEMLTLAGAGVFTIFLIDAFAKLGARMK